MFAGKHEKVGKKKSEACSNHLSENQKLAGLPSCLNWCLRCDSIADVNDFGFHNAIPMLRALIFRLQPDELKHLDYLLANPFAGQGIDAAMLADYPLVQGGKTSTQAKETDLTK